MQTRAMGPRVKHRNRPVKHKTASRAAIAALILLPGAATAAQSVLYEESAARHEESLIIASPIGGIENSRWYDYRINVTESQKELARDLRHAGDIEDQRDAWSEYAHELKNGRHDYVKEMARRGYRIPQIYFD